MKEAKGFFGELVIRFLGWVGLDKTVYRRLHNVTIELPDGTTQIDHVFVSRYGIFVVETKTLKGWIFGSERNATWTQKLYKQTFKFQNPLRQNYKHVKALEQVLGVDTRNIHSVVACAGSAELKTAMPDNVTVGYGYVRYIKRFQDLVWTDSEVDEIAGRLRSSRLAPTRETHRRHVAHLKERHGQEPSVKPVGKRRRVEPALGLDDDIKDE
ncbi:MAG: NERD domain-containing protein [Chromatiales bacterium]|nr:NERD domain-containing protein [Chromatiales bacterium]